MRLSLLRRAVVGLTAVAACVAGSVALAASAEAKIAAAHGASYWHPYSNPTWYPLRGSDATMDCAHSNPGCSSGKLHADQAMSLLSRTMVGNHPVYHRAPVYAAGAGVIHIGHDGGNRCINGNSLGSWVWVDHGAGVLSRYGHLDGILKSVHNGMYVTPNTIIGYTGHSGENIHGDCYRATNYLNFQIEHNGLYGKGVPLTTLHVCSGGRAVSWPNRVHASWSTFQQVPQHSELKNSNQSATSCVKHSWLTTAGLPTAKLAHHPTSVHASWNAPKSSYHVKGVYVELQLWHPANHTWSVESRRNFSSVPHSTSFGGLLHKRVYRTNVNFYNSAGWSRASGWHQTKTT